VTSRPAPARIAVAAALDVATILIFVAIGREEHDDGTPATPYLEVAAPFLIGLVVAWAAMRVWQRPLEWRTGLAVWAITVLLGMILRRTLFDDGTALAFVIVASAFLGVTIVGWRFLASLIERDATRP
jgi:hypothetical protein